MATRGIPSVNAVCFFDDPKFSRNFISNLDPNTFNMDLYSRRLTTEKSSINLKTNKVKPVVGGFNPSETYISQIGSFPLNRGKTSFKKIF